MNITNYAIKKSVTTFVLMIVLIIAGLSAYVSLPREAAPDIQIPYIIVNTLYYGVGPSDIETLVTNPLEKKFKGINNIKEMTSQSNDSISSIFLKFDTKVDIDEALRKVKEKVDAAKPDLPPDAEDPEVIEINLSDIPIMVINISGPYGLEKLKKTAENLKEKLEGIKGILDITISGGLEREIQIIADKDLLKKHEISLNQISQMISAENINIPGGAMDIGRSKYLIRVPGEVKKVNELENIVLATPKKQPIYLKDVASVVDSFKERDSYSRMNNTESVSLSIQKRSGENVIRISDKIKAILEQETKNMPDSTKINIVADQSKTISEMVDELENSIILGLLLVVAVLFFFMGGRNAFFVSTAIPLSMLITFIVIQVMGYTLNMVLLFSLILALGMLVDNAVVIVENIYRFLENGHSKKEAAMLATNEVAMAVFSSTTTTVAAFIPLIFVPGIAGEFMKYLPIGVIISISASLFVAMVFNPVMCATNMKIDPKYTKKVENNFQHKLTNFYRVLLHWALKNRKKTIFITIAAFFLSIALFIIINPGQEFFPSSTPDKIYIEITTPEDSTLDTTNQIIKPIELFLLKEKNVVKIITTVGAGSGSWFSGGQSSPNKSRIIAEFPDKKQWAEHPNVTINKIREFVSSIPGADINITKERMGPPTGADIGIELIGEDFATLDQLSYQVQKRLAAIPGVTDIKDDYNKGRPEVSIELNRDRAALLGLNTALVAATIRTAIQGTKISIFREGNDEYDITLKLPMNKENGLQQIEELSILTPKGIPVPLLEIAKINTKASVSAIRHKDQDRVITVEAAAKEGYLPYKLLQAAKPKLKGINLPDGYKIRYAGEDEDRKEIASYMGKAFFIALFLIYMCLVWHFNSLSIPIIISTSIFFSLMGIFMGLVIFHRPFGIVMTGMGVVSLSGVVVNNAIVLIEYIVQLQERGLNRMAAVLKAGAIRLRPVLLTAITAILGLVPMTFGINFNFKSFYNNLFILNPLSNFWQALELQSQSTEFWGSMGSAVTIGLTVSTVLTLIVVPVLYISFYNVFSKKKGRKK